MPRCLVDLAEQAGLWLAAHPALHQSKAASVSHCRLCCCTAACHAGRPRPHQAGLTHRPLSLLLQLFLTKYTPFMVFPADAPPGATLGVATNVLIKVLRSSAHTNATRVAAAACLTRLAGEGPARSSPVLAACRQQGLATACFQHRRAAQTEGEEAAFVTSRKCPT